MTMDEVVNLIEGEVRSKLSPLLTAPEMTVAFEGPKIGSIRHAREVHCMGLSCHPKEALSDSDTYSICFNIFDRAISGAKDFSVRGFVSWDQPFIAGKLRGYHVAEGATAPVIITDRADLVAFGSQVDRLVEVFRRGLRRGRLPSCMRRLFLRLFAEEGTIYWPAYPDPNKLRISDQSCHSFRTKVSTCFGAKLPAISV
jgi:hypothetical protein